jgi:type I restriction enzyme M protein
MWSRAVSARGGSGAVSQPDGFADKVAFVWRVADKLRGHFKSHEYGQVMLPLLVLRRLDAVLEPTKQQVLKTVDGKPDNAGTRALLKKAAGQQFYNTSPLTFTTLLNDDKNVAASLRAYVNAFSPDAVEVLEAYDFDAKIARLDKAGILYQVLGDFADLDLHPDRVSNDAMGYIFEELLRRFSEMSNETAGEHYTPREVIRLMVNLLFAEDQDALAGERPVRTIYDPAAGTGGMLTVAQHTLALLNPNAHLEVYGQELNPETWAIARSDLMITGSDPTRIQLGNTLTEDAFPTQRFDYLLANPPFGVDWKAYADPIKHEADKQGWQGRFGAGLPRVSDGSMLFLQHMISKFKPVADDPGTPWVDGGTRMGIVLSGSPLFSGAAGSGESEIRRWILEGDLLEGIVALPDQMFYNTGISTYVWILTNRKPDDRKGKVVLVDARESGTKMRKSLGDKRKELTDDAIAAITRLFVDALHIDDPRVKVMANEVFGFARLTVERPLRRVWRIDDTTWAAIAASKPAQESGFDGLPPERVREYLEERYAKLGTITSEKQITSALMENMGGGLPVDFIKAVAKLSATTDDSAAPVKAKKGGGYEPDPDLRDQENIPLPPGYLHMTDTQRTEAVQAAAEKHLAQEIHPYVPDAWIDHDKTKIGYEIPFTRQFYAYTPPRPVAEIRAEIDQLEQQIQELMRGLA